MIEELGVGVVVLNGGGQTGDAGFEFLLTSEVERLPGFWLRVLFDHAVVRADEKVVDIHAGDLFPQDGGAAKGITTMQRQRMIEDVQDAHQLDVP